jgi:hypothetical protein
MDARRRLMWIALAAAGLLAAGALASTRYELVLRVRHPVEVGLAADLPAVAKISQRVGVRLDEELHAQAELGMLSVPLDETLDVQLDARLDLPIHATVRLAEAIPVEADVPIRTTLTERELGTLSLEVPIDADMMVDDVIVVDTVVPLDTHVQTALGIRVPVKANVPIRARVPIKQRIHVRDRLAVKVAHFKFPLQTELHVSTKVPLTAPLTIEGRAQIPLKQRLRIPLKQTLHPQLKGALPVTVRITGDVPAEVHGDLRTSVHVEGPLQTTLGAVRVALEDVVFEPRTAP